MSEGLGLMPTDRSSLPATARSIAAVRTSAAKAGIPYQRFIRQALEDAVQRKRA